MLSYISRYIGISVPLFGECWATAADILVSVCHYLENVELQQQIYWYQCGIIWRRLSYISRYIGISVPLFGECWATAADVLVSVCHYLENVELQQQIYWYQCAIIWRMLSYISRYIGISAPLFGECWATSADILVSVCHYLENGELHQQIYWYLCAIIWRMLSYISRYIGICVPLFGECWATSADILVSLRHYLENVELHQQIYRYHWAIIWRMLSYISRYVGICVPLFGECWATSADILVSVRRYLENVELQQRIDSYWCASVRRIRGTPP